ncbi:hypothetical protein [Streptomyces ficellus]|uniref:hypothetical protein n=1 Tax=Streptomyces ficellus TaxID=1977088 RepID=UPI001FCB8049|nr:hypothetical protein [Streptomyces ficellus]
MRVRGYLVRRSIGYGLRRQESVEDSGAVPTLPEADVSGWSPAARRGDGRRPAAGRTPGRPARDRLDPLAALCADPACRAVEVLTRAGVDAAVPAAATADRLNRCHRLYAPDAPLP